MVLYRYGPSGSIARIIKEIYDEFEIELRKKNSYCNFLDITYRNGHIPSYSERDCQLYYLLRYTFAWAAAYRELFDAILPEFYEDKKSIEVTSLGSGANLDYWAVCQSAVSNMYELGINYYGIDKEEWVNVFERRKSNNTVCNVKKDIAEYISGFDEISSDVYLFPMSISELDFIEIVQLGNFFAQKRMTNKRCYLGITMRLTNNENDQKSMHQLYDIIGEKRNVGYLEEVERASLGGITAKYKDMWYPDTIKDRVISLFDNCPNHRNCNNGMKCDNLIHQTPITNNKHTKNYYFYFEER